MKKERKLIIAGNWKMNKTVAEALALVADLKRDLANIKEVDIVVARPSPRWNPSPRPSLTPTSGSARRT